MNAERSHPAPAADTAGAGVIGTVIGTRAETSFEPRSQREIGLGQLDASLAEPIA